MLTILFLIFRRIPTEEEGLWSHYDNTRPLSHEVAKFGVFQMKMCGPAYPPSKVVVLFEHFSRQVVDVFESVGTQVYATVPPRHHHHHVLRINDLKRTAQSELSDKLRMFGWTAHSDCCICSLSSYLHQMKDSGSSVRFSVIFAAFQHVWSLNSVKAGNRIVFLL